MHSERYMDREPSLGAVRRDPKANQKGVMLDFLWVPAVLIFAVGDIVTTQLALDLGAVEANGIVRFLIEGTGGLWAFAMLKASILLVLLFLSFAALRKFRWIVPSFLCCAGAYLLAGNLSVIFSLL